MLRSFALLVAAGSIALGGGGVALASLSKAEVDQIELELIKLTCKVWLNKESVSYYKPDLYEGMMRGIFSTEASISDVDQLCRLMEG